MDNEMGPETSLLKGSESGVGDQPDSSTGPPRSQGIEHLFLAKVDPEEEDEWMADHGISYVNMIGVGDCPMIEETPPFLKIWHWWSLLKGKFLASQRESSLSLSRESSPENSLLVFHGLIQEMETKMRKMERDSLLRFGGLDTRMQTGFDSHSASFESKLSDFCLKIEQSIFGKMQNLLAEFEARNIANTQAHLQSTVSEGIKGLMGHFEKVQMAFQRDF